MSGVDFDREIAQIYRDMELYLIESMQRNLARHLAEETDAGLRYPQWQAEKLKELKRYQRENRQIISSRTRGLSDRVSEHMKAELRQGSKHELKRYKKALGKGYKSAKTMRKSFFKVNDRKISGMINALQNDLGAANTAVLRMMNDTYRQTIFRAGMYASNGVMTETQAYDMAVKDFLERGINCIEYRDGRRVNIADYASMAVRTANQRAYMVGEGEFRKSIGETLVIISHHATACKLCRPFERKVLIDDVYSGGKPGDGDYMLLSEAMKLGLFHPRCRHGLGTYYPELEEINHYNNEENDVSDYGRYNRAHIENMVQRYKRLTVGSVDPENVARYQAKLKEWNAKLDNSTENGIIKLHRGANRKNENIGAFSNFGIPMQKRAVLKLCAKYGVSTEGLTIKIQRDENLLGLPFCGSADYDNIGRIDLFPKAFTDEEQLIKTVLHEKCHVLQLQRHGKKYVQDNLDKMEKAASKFETIYYNALKRGKKK